VGDAVVRGKIAAALRSDNDVFEGEDYTAAFVLLQETDVDILLLGLPLPSGGVSECVELLQRLDGSEIDTLVIVLSEDTKRSSALKVIEAGSYDYFILPIDMEVLRMLIARGIEKLQIQRENRILREEIRRKDSLGDLIGSTDAMRHLFSSIQRMARSDANVVIRGESGTGERAGGASAARPGAAAKQAVHRSELRGAAGKPDGSGIIRVRTRRVHRRGGDQGRAHRAGGGRDVIPG
jgi:DNA-binding NtrC family response regulator